MPTYGDLANLIRDIDQDIRLWGATSDFLELCRQRVEVIGTAMRTEEFDLELATNSRVSDLPFGKELGPLVRTRFAELQAWREEVKKLAST